MALIVCPECGKTFSDRAAACPECGCPTSEIIGQSNSSIGGQLIVANNAFDDGRYDEAYQIYSQAYVKNQTDAFIMIRLGLVTGAKDLFALGVPNSTKELIKTAICIEKVNAANLEQFCTKIIALLDDAESVIRNVTASVANGSLKLLEQTEETRSAGAMVADALFMPVVSANRNLYEDRKTLNRNSKIINTAVQSLDDVKLVLRNLRSFILNSIAGAFGENEKANAELSEKLNDFVADTGDNDVIKDIVADEDAMTYGLCFGGEIELLSLKNVTAFYYIGNQVQNQSFLSTPVGDFRMTNYKIEYTSHKPKCCFNLSLQHLSSIGSGGVGGSFLEMKFLDGKKILLAVNNVNAVAGALRIAFGL